MLKMRQKRRRETDPAPRGTGALPPPPARKYAAKAEDIDTFSDDEEDDEEHDPSDEPFVVKQTTFPLLQLASSMTGCARRVASSARVLSIRLELMFVAVVVVFHLAVSLVRTACSWRSLLLRR